MRYLILSDIHANLEALEAVLAHAGDDPYDRVLVLGDLVGYGADPNGVVDRVRALQPDVLIRGNHDKVAAGIEDPEGFNYMAREAAMWTQHVLSPANRHYLAELPRGPVVVDELVQVCHGAPYDEDAYIFDPLDALEAIKISEHPLLLFGHTHVPVLFSLTETGLDTRLPSGEAETLWTLDPSTRYLMNPGSVGQPRDGDPRAAYAVLDGQRRALSLRRVPYQVAVAQEKIIAAGLPEPLAFRLGQGR